MASICLKIDGKQGEISVRSLLTSLEHQLLILEDLDSAISRASKGTLDWVVSDVKSGSICITVDSRSRVEDRNVGPDVARSYVEGFRQIEYEGTTPPYFSEFSMRNARKMLRVIGHNGATGLTIETPLVEAPVQLTPVAAVNIDQLLPTRHQSIGSVEGVIETISIHGKTRFVMYHARTRKAVECAFDAARWLPTIKDALGQRVSVSGRVHYNAKGEPMRVDIEDIRFLRDKSLLPRVADLTGRYPDITGGLETVEYLRRARNG